MRSLKDLRVLFIEDTEDFALTLAALVKSSGPILKWVPSVEAALEAMQEIVYDVVLMDYHLPGLCGSEGIKKLREQSPSMPVIVLSGDDSLESITSCMEAGAQEYLFKLDVSGEDWKKLLPPLLRAIRWADEFQQRERIANNIVSELAVLKAKTQNTELAVIIAKLEAIAKDAAR